MIDSQINYQWICRSMDPCRVDLALVMRMVEQCIKQSKAQSTLEPSHCLAVWNVPLLTEDIFHMQVAGLDQPSFKLGQLKTAAA